MKYRAGMVCGVLCAWLVVAGGAAAHHGGAGYDVRQTLTVKATIVEFRFINPHVMVLFDEIDGKGHVTRWTAESPDDPAMLKSQGWTQHTLKAGDLVTIQGHPAKSGAKVMSLVKVILPDGREFASRVVN